MLPYVVSAIEQALRDDLRARVPEMLAASMYAVDAAKNKYVFDVVVASGDTYRFSLRLDRVDGYPNPEHVSRLAHHMTEQVRVGLDTGGRHNESCSIEEIVNGSGCQCAPCLALGIK